MYKKFLFLILLTPFLMHSMHHRKTTNQPRQAQQMEITCSTCDQFAEEQRKMRQTMQIRKCDSCVWKHRKEEATQACVLCTAACVSTTTIFAMMYDKTT